MLIPAGHAIAFPHHRGPADIVVDVDGGAMGGGGSKQRPLVDILRRQQLREDEDILAIIMVAMRVLP